LDVSSPVSLGVEYGSDHIKISLHAHAIKYLFASDIVMVYHSLRLNLVADLRPAPKVRHIPLIHHRPHFFPLNSARPILIQLIKKQLQFLLLLHHINTFPIKCFNHRFCETKELLFRKFTILSVDLEKFPKRILIVERVDDFVGVAPLNVLCRVGNMLGSGGRLGVAKLLRYGDDLFFEAFDFHRIFFIFGLVFAILFKLMLVFFAFLSPLFNLMGRTLATLVH
jgi:hypothetical protein